MRRFIDIVEGNVLPYPAILKDSFAIADYIEETSSDEVDIEMMQEYFQGQCAVLKMIPIDDIVEGPQDSNVGSPSKEKSYAKLTTPVPPLVVDDEGQIIDGNHRYRVAKMKNITELPCYVVEDIENTYRIS